GGRSWLGQDGSARGAGEGARRRGNGDVAESGRGGRARRRGGGGEQGQGVALVIAGDEDVGAVDLAVAVEVAAVDRGGVGVGDGGARAGEVGDVDGRAAGGAGVAGETCDIED